MYFCLPIFNMLQRIQTIYILVALLLSVSAVFLLPLWSTVEGQSIFALDLFKDESNWMLFSIPVVFILSGILSLISLLLFKNRNKQTIFNRLNMVLNLYLLGIFVYHVLSLPGESEISEKGIGQFVPVLVIVFLVLANKAIQKDEALVKSVDRLR